MINYLTNIEQFREKRWIILKNSFKKEAKYLSHLLSKKYDFKKLYLFGSLTTKKPLKSWSDIDFVIEGLKKELFLKFYADLLKNSRFPVDLKPFEGLNENIKKGIRKNGIVLYGKK